MTSRYESRPVKVTTSRDSENVKKRGNKNIIHYVGPTFDKITEDLYDSNQLEFHVWKIGTRFYKLASEHYGDPRLWWVIAYFNKKPTDSHVSLGEVVYVPTRWHPIFDAIAEHNLEY